MKKRTPGPNSDARRILGKRELEAVGGGAVKGEANDKDHDKQIDISWR